MASAIVQNQNQPFTASIQERIECTIDTLLNSLPDVHQLSPNQRRGIIARYSAVLEGNFIYWMTGTYLSVESEEARSIILSNLTEEIRDCHPGMLRKFATAARAFPTDSDHLAVQGDLMKVRHFVGRLEKLHLLLMMTFFEGFIQRFMPYLAELAKQQGSAEQQYTDVHGVCDIAHSQELFRALEGEIALHGRNADENLFEGVDLLSSLITAIADPQKN